MKIKAGSNVGIGGDVTKGKSESPFWTHFKDIAWLTITLTLIVSTVILYAVTGEIEITNIFAGLIGVALGQLFNRNKESSRTQDD